jgi:Ca-activated chloride channel homolog
LVFAKNAVHFCDIPMNWFHQISRYEYLLIGIFILLYGVFTLRTIVMARRLRSGIHLFWVKFFLRSLFFALLIVSLLGPSFGGVKKEVKAVGKDIVVAIDLSRSINCTDVQPSRLQKIKFELKKVLDAFAADRISLIVFSGEAFLYCPFTFDKGALQTLLETASSNAVPSDGTDFGSALELARQKFNENQTKNQKISSKIILLVSDGEDFGEDTDDAVSALEKEGIKVFSLGVGTPEGAGVPNGEGGFILDENGEPVVAKLSSKDLRAISSQTGGLYFEVTNEKNEVPAMMEAIQNIEGEVWDVQVVDIGANKYFYFLFVALGILLVDVLFTINVMKV